jgi:hypothetical protein
MRERVRVLTIRQPWAWAIIHGGKDVENRSWRTAHRGPLLIHAGARFDRSAEPEVRRLASQGPPPPDEYELGAIVGVVELVDCVRDARSPWAEAGFWHWVLTGARPVDPVSCPGRLGLWRPPPDFPG